MSDARTLTGDERKAVASLERLAKRWPDTLGLFSWSGSLVVVRLSDDGGWPWLGDLRMDEDQIITTIQGIKNDGGDPR